MKNKILVLFLLSLIILPMFNFVNAYTELNSSDSFCIDDNVIKELPERPLKLEEWNLSSELLKEAKNFGYISSFNYVTPSGRPKMVGEYIIYIFGSDVKAYYTDGISGGNPLNDNLYFKISDGVVTVLRYYSNWQKDFAFEYEAVILNSEEFNINAGRYFNIVDKCSISTVPIYKNNTFTEIYKEPNYIQDDSIGDLNSDLQLFYEYNEDNTSCHINATLKNGAFTDQIYYSNYQPGITGELLSKKAFPKDGIDVTENQSLFFQAEDKDGKILAKNSISIFRNWKIRSR